MNQPDQPIEAPAERITCVDDLARRRSGGVMGSVDCTDLEHLNYGELLTERLKCMVRIQEIILEKGVTGRPDDAPYRKWLRRINEEHAGQRHRLGQIKLLLPRRQVEDAEKRRAARKG